jgi:hypothetical protein
MKHDGVPACSEENQSNLDWVETPHEIPALAGKMLRLAKRLDLSLRAFFWPPTCIMPAVLMVALRPRVSEAGKRAAARLNQYAPRRMPRRAMAIGSAQ